MCAQFHLLDSDSYKIYLYIAFKHMTFKEIHNYIHAKHNL